MRNSTIKQKHITKRKRKKKKNRGEGTFMGVGVRNMTTTSELNCHKSVSMLIRSQVDVVARYKLFCYFFVFICLLSIN